MRSRRHRALLLNARGSGELEQLVPLDERDASARLALGSVEDRDSGASLLALCSPHALTLIDAITLSPRARIALPQWLADHDTLLGAIGLSRAGVILGVTRSGRLFTLELATRALRYTSTLAADALLEAALSPDERTLAIASRRGDEAHLLIYDLSSSPLTPRLHLDALDVRDHRSPLRAMRDAELSLAISEDGEQLFLQMSRAGRSLDAVAASWPGWRASVAGLDVASGRVAWVSEIDAELTGDWRGLRELGREDAPLAPPLCPNPRRPHELWVAGHDASLTLLDARDGALIERHVTPGSLATLALCSDPDTPVTYLLDEREQLTLFREDARAFERAPRRSPETGER